MSRAKQRKGRKKRGSGAPPAPPRTAEPEIEAARKTQPAADDRVLRWACVVGPLAPMLLLAFTPGISFTEDLGRHILLGRIIVEQGAVPDTNYLSYTHAEFPFLNHHWLSEVFFYQIHRFVGLNGLIVWKMITMVLTLGLALAALAPRRGHGLYWLAGTLSAVILGFRSHIRPELVSYLGIALYLFCFERIRRGAVWPRWLMTGFAMLWANAHIYFVFGVGMAGAFLIERVVADRSRASLRREGGWFAALVVASCIGPNGIDGFLYPLTIFSNYSFDVIENGPPQRLWKSVVNPMLMALPLLSAGLVAALAVLWRARNEEETRRRLADVIVAGTALLASWVMVRSTPLLALSALPVIAAALGRRRASERPRLLDRRGVSWATASLALLLTLFVSHGLLEGWYTRIFPSPIGPTSLGFEDERRFERLRELATRHPLRGPVYSDFKIGSLVEYQLYPEPGYVDNRPEAFPGPFWRTEYNPSRKLDKAWDRVRDERDLSTVVASLVGSKERFIQTLRRRKQNWVLVDLDPLAAVFVRNDARNEALIGELRFTEERIDTYEQELVEAIAVALEQPWWRRQVDLEWAIHGLYSLICIGEYARAWPHLRELHRHYPDYQLIQELMRVSVPKDRPELMYPILERAARWPLAAKQPLDWARRLIAQGKLQEARRVLVRGRRFFPLSDRLRKKIEGIDDQLYRKQQRASRQSLRRAEAPPVAR